MFFFFPNITNGQIITSIAGGGTGGDGTEATAASIFDPHGGVFDNGGNLYIVEGQGNKIRKVDAFTGIITTVVGTGSSGYNGDGIPATSANITPNAIAIDTVGNLFITDSARIRKIDMATGLISTIAGGGSLLGDGIPATAAMFQVPWGICFDKHGNLYFGEPLGYKLRKINTSGIISTITGNGVAGFSGDYGPATAAKCGQVFGVCSDIVGNVYFADCVNNDRIRKIDTSGIITTIVGTGISPYNGDTIPATNAHIGPLDVKIDASGNLYIIYVSNIRIRKVTSSGVIYTLTGTGVNGYNGDGIAADTAKIYDPGGLAIDLCGNVYFGDIGNERFRKVTVPPIYTIPSISLSGTTTAAAGATVTVTATVANASSSYTIYWRDNGVAFATTTIPTVTYTKGADTDTITALIVPTGYGCWDSATSAGLVVRTTEGIPLVRRGGGPSIWPNPVSEQLHIDGLQTESVYKLVSMVGEVVGQGVLNKGNNMVPVKQLPTSIYIMEVTMEGERVITRIVKM